MISVTLTQLDNTRVNYDTLKNKWLNLQKKSKSNFFISWVWIGKWLKSINKNYYLVEAVDGDKTVGLGILVPKTDLRFGFIPIKQLYLNRTGSAKEDQIWIEYNDFLLDEAKESVIRKKMIAELVCYKKLWSELHIGISEISVLENNIEASLRINMISILKGYYNSLPLGNNIFEAILASFSKNTRYQIKRSQKLLSTLGPLSIKSVQSPDQALSCLEDIAKGHRDKWKNTPSGSGFDNHHFTSFHHDMVKHEIDNNTADILVLLGGKEVLGYLYNFCYQKKVYFYLSNIKQHANNKIKIGLLMHTLAMEHYAKKGFEIYDFLAGDARYKKSLSSKTYEMGYVCYYRPTLYLKFENSLRKIKQRISMFSS